MTCNSFSICLIKILFYTDDFTKSNSITFQNYFKLECKYKQFSIFLVITFVHVPWFHCRYTIEMTQIVWMKITQCFVNGLCVLIIHHFFFIKKVTIKRKEIYTFWQKKIEVIDLSKRKESLEHEGNSFICMFWLTP